MRPGRGEKDQINRARRAEISREAPLRPSADEPPGTNPAKRVDPDTGITFRPRGGVVALVRAEETGLNWRACSASPARGRAVSALNEHPSNGAAL